MVAGQVDECIDCGELFDRAGSAPTWEPAYLDVSDTNERVCPTCWQEVWDRCGCCGDARPLGSLTGYVHRNLFTPDAPETRSHVCDDCLDCPTDRSAECLLLERRGQNPWFHEVAPREVWSPEPVTDAELSEVTAMIAESARRLDSRRPSEL